MHCILHFYIVDGYQKQCTSLPTDGNRELNQVEEFKYRGVVYDSTAIKETAVNDRINKYSMNVGMLYPLLKDRRATCGQC